MTTRAALDRLHQGLEDHLAAVAAKAGENDPAVQAAYLALRSAAQDYDEALYLAHDEVTPFDLPALPEDDGDETAAEDGRLTVLTRWEFTVHDPIRLCTQASEALGEQIDDPAVALTALAHLGARRGPADPEFAGSAGLEWHGAVTAVLPAIAVEGAGEGAGELEWFDDPFAAIDPDQVLCSFADVPGAAQR